MKTAIVYDRVNKWGGAERVLLALHEIYPDAHLFTSVYSAKKASWAKVFPKVVTSFLQKLPLGRERHELLPYLMPLAFETLDLSDYDLVISVTSEAAKGVLVRPNAVHICYMLTPTRYLWSGYEDYFKGKTFKALTFPVVKYLRRWDKVSSHRPDHLIAISTEVRDRIKKFYGRESAVIHSPVEFDKFAQNKPLKKSDYYLYVSRLVPYKRADLAVEAFNELGKSLVIVGEGSEERKLKRLAKRNIKFIDRLTDKELADYYQKAKAFIFPQIEDFGIVALEAQASGTPVIAFRGGGALDTVIEEKTGIFFDKQDKESLVKAVKRFEKMTFDHKDLLENAKKFSKQNFHKKFAAFVSDLLAVRIN